MNIRFMDMRWMAAAVAALCLTGCVKKSVSDASLVTAIQSKLYADDTTKAANIKVDAKDGVITLSGDVPSSDVELEAMKVANATDGVTKVNDQLKVNAAAMPGPDAAGSALAANTPSPTDAKPAAQIPPPAAAPTPAPAATTPPAMADSNTAPESTEAPVRRKREVAALTVPAGSRMQVRMIDAIDSHKNSVGQTFNATLDSPLIAGNRVAIAAGAPVTVELTNARAAGRVKGSSELAVRVTNISANGRSYQIASDVYDEVGKGKGKQTAIRTGIGAAAGALIGGLAGGGKGAAIGSAAGGGAGFGYQFFTHGSQVKIPSESVLTFRLAEPLSVQR